MVTLEKTAVPLHVMSNDEILAMREVWSTEWFDAYYGNDGDRIQQAESFSWIYEGEWMRRDPMPR